MKACAGAAGAVVGLVLVSLVALYLVPRLKAGSNNSPSSTQVSAGDNRATGVPSERLDVPKSETERLKGEVERKRIPFFQMIHDRFGDQIERASVLDDVDTLDLVVKKGDPDTVQGLVQNAVGPTARQYGFERVRFYVSNPISKVEPYKIVAESSWDGSSRWNTFLK
jgi:hypothetical protein